MTAFIWVHDLSPFLVHFSLAGHDVGIRWYGMAYVTGFWLAWRQLHLAAVRHEIDGLDEAAVGALVWAIVVGVLLGGRAAFVLQHLGELQARPFFFFEVWNGGMTFFGGLAGLVLGIAYVARRLRLEMAGLLDVLAVPLTLALGVGRLANFINGELPGRPTDGTWGVIFPRVDMLARHPSQLYEAASHFLLYGLLLVVAWRRPRWLNESHGRMFALFLLLYGLLRVLTDAFRQDETYWGPLSSGQWASLLVAACGLGAPCCSCSATQRRDSVGRRSTPRSYCAAAA